MRTFQEMYRSLKRRLYALDRRLGNKLPPIQKEEAPLNMHDPNSSDSSSDSEDSVSGEADDNGNTIDNDMSLDTLAEAATANEANINDDSEETALNHLDSDLDEQNNEGKDEQPGKSNSEQSSVIVVRQVSRRTSRGNVNTAADEQTSIENSKQAEAPISMYDMFVEGRKRPSSELARAKMLGLAKTDNEQPPSRSATSRSDRSNSSGGGNRNRRRLY
jgi:hypothetical protein